MNTMEQTPQNKNSFIIVSFRQLYTRTNINNRVLFLCMVLKMTMKCSALTILRMLSGSLFQVNYLSVRFSHMKQITVK